MKYTKYCLCMCVHLLYTPTAVGRLTFVPIRFDLLKPEASRHVTLNGAVRFKVALHPAEPKKNSGTGGRCYK